jgi:hypothetical protein
LALILGYSGVNKTKFIGINIFRKEFKELSKSKTKEKSNG